jgi:hypothetical protein
LSDAKQQSIDAVMSRLLEPAGLGEQQLSDTLGTVMRGGVDYADLYFVFPGQPTGKLVPRGWHYPRG